MPLFPKDKRTFRLFLVLVVLHLLLISIQVPRGSAPSFFERGVFFVVSPIQHGAVAVFRFVRGIGTGYFFLIKVQRQNQALRQEEFILRQENARLRQSLGKALAVKDMEARLQGGPGTVLAASVISLDPVSYYKSVVIDRGRLDGLAKDMVVVDRWGNLVGRVIEPISLKEASVQLITDDGSGTSVFIKGDKGLGVVTGDGRGRCLLKYILDTAEGIVAGDEVLTMGSDKIYPWGIPVGRIVSVTSNQSLFKDVIVQPNFHFRELSQVAVLKTQGGQ
jgi:rod shape-determining protein MreC